MNIIYIRKDFNVICFVGIVEIITTILYFLSSLSSDEIDLNHDSNTKKNLIFIAFFAKQYSIN